MRTTNIENTANAQRHVNINRNHEEGVNVDATCSCGPCHVISILNDSTLNELHERKHAAGCGAQ